MAVSALVVASEGHGEALARVKNAPAQKVTRTASRQIHSQGFNVTDNKRLRVRPH